MEASARVPDDGGWGGACMRVCTPAQSLAVGTADFAAPTVATVAAVAYPCFCITVGEGA